MHFIIRLRIHFSPKAEQVDPLNKRLLVALSVSALLLGGCATAENAGDRTSTGAASAEASTEPSERSAAPSVTPPVELPAAPSAEPTPLEVEPTPLEVEPSAESSEPSPAPAEVQEPPAAAPSVPAPGDPHLPSDTSPYPGSSPSVAFSAPVTAEWSIWIAGRSWKVTGSGYVPGEQLQVSFGPANTDVLVAETFVTVDADGHYLAWLDVPASAAPGTYGILTSAVPFTEVSKRYGAVEVVAAF